MSKFDSNYIFNLLEKNFFLKKKKNIKVVDKLSIEVKYRRVYVFIYLKLKEYWNIFMRFESLFGFLPKINTLTRRRKGKLKKIIFLRSFLLVKSFSTYEKKSLSVLDYILNFNNYLYVRFLLNKKFKAFKLEEMANYFIKNYIFIQKNSIVFENGLYWRWLDISRNFISLKRSKRVYKTKADSFKFRKAKYYKSNIIIESPYCKFFILPVKILIKNYRKLILFLFKKFRKRKKDEKAYILL